MMRVYIVLEEDRGLGVSVAGVFASLEAAQAYLSGPEGSNCYLYSDEGEEIHSTMNDRLISLARETAWSDDEEFNPYDKSGGNYDDAYYGGCNDGETHLARWILDSMGIEWKE